MGRPDEAHIGITFYVTPDEIAGNLTDRDLRELLRCFSDAQLLAALGPDRLNRLNHLLLQQRQQQQQKGGA